MRRASDGGQLSKNILTVTIIFDHAPHAARLSFKALQAFDQLVTSSGR
jgi:hypothetical protein